MRNLIALAGISILIALVGCSEADSHRVPNPEQFLQKNSCAISCPAESAFPDTAGSVTCGETTLPICQCNYPHKPMASCEETTVVVDPPLPEMERPIIEEMTAPNIPLEDDG